jgi:hypothetical protein
MMELLLVGGFLALPLLYTISYAAWSFLVAAGLIVLEDEEGR